MGVILRRVGLDLFVVTFVLAGGDVLSLLSFQILLMHQSALILLIRVGLLNLNLLGRPCRSAVGIITTLFVLHDLVFLLFKIRLAIVNHVVLARRVGGLARVTNRLNLVLI